MAAMPIPAPSLRSGQLSSNSTEIADFGIFGEWDFLFGDFTADFPGFGEI
ncbi:hypothetical protein H103_07293 [Trichophyton rubrum CBS 288.86]|uniref:Uncharacterized protein n=2 Tax=Trichophyton TaxID=5550 RepID=A0A022VT16_TRIRU|nr:hypothetical protein H100_07310 [Trichophyton rubrum MR850]EZF38476.1 hypothetical protein H102_07271 [Trichophyton rubrum CBS 100081]EZF49171.1 hypothetical protein H103_07293 [Trichophyton rubrum CBS 288.86]EZF59816.1 hypothetical protein H104_07246 [Trichophyton rubrum CBS 289.86]EZF70499.1 hypothetical protein H105_07309 [Trichophyton soudanense CBS 452.61]EZF81104.1 hypothetical protein H110_07292 [Trichophyton rubrum MR1448]EZG02761.1 hypothetical protein H106_07131 [Trichophyton rub